MPSLTEITLDSLAAHCDAIVDLRGITEELAATLLWKVLELGRLDYRLAIVFRDAGHDSIREAIESLDLLSGIPTHNSITRRKGL